MAHEKSQLAHIAMKRGPLILSGYRTCGDAQLNRAIIHIDRVPGKFSVGHDGKRYAHPSDKLWGFTPASLLLLAETCMFGLEIAD